MRITADSVGATTTERPRMFVLAIGVNTYRMKQYQLKYAAPDAIALSKALQEVGGGLFSEVRVKTLTDEQVSDARDAAYEGYHGHGILTYALLEAFNKLNAGGSDESVRVSAVADYVGLRVPEISQKSFGIIQNPTRKLSGNDFAIGIRQQVMAAAEPVIPREATHVLIRTEVVREKPAADAEGVRTLTPGTQVRAVEFSGAWAIIAREGQKIGYVPADALARLQ